MSAGQLTAAPGLGPVAALRARAEAMEAGDWPHTSRLLPWGIAAFMTMVWLVPFDSVKLPISLPLDATLDRPLLVGLFALWLVAILSGNSERAPRATPVHWALLTFALVALTSIVLDMAKLAGLGELSLAVKEFSLLLTYGICFVLAAAVIRPTEVPAFIKLMVVLASITAVGILVEYRTGYNAFYEWISLVLPVTRPDNLGGYDSIGRLVVVGPGQHPLAPAVMMALALPFAIVGVMRSEERRTRIWYSVATALIVAAAISTQRKTSLILPIAGVLVMLAYRPRAIVKLLPVGVVMVFAIHLIAPQAIGGVVDQLKPSALTGVLTTKDRVSDYDAIRPEIANRPVFGRGYESYDQKKYRILDNQYLTLLIGTGIAGVIAYLGMFATVFLVAHRLARSRDRDASFIGVAVAAAMVSLTLASQLLDVISLPQLPYLFGLIAALLVVSSRSASPGAHGLQPRR